MRHFLQYWKCRIAEYTADTPLNHSASSQLGRVSRGDILWIVTIREHRLKLLGRLVIGDILGERAAKRKLGSDLYKAKYHAVGQEGTVHKQVEIDIHRESFALRFESPIDRLTLTRSGQMDGKQLQSIRELTLDSADDLARTLRRKVSVVPAQVTRAKPRIAYPRRRRSSPFTDMKSAVAFLVGSAERTLVPAHYNYQVRLKQFLKSKGIASNMERDFVDVDFSIDGERWIGEIKITTHLTPEQAFRTALGQILDYASVLFETPPRMAIFLEFHPDEKRLILASKLGIAVVVAEDDDFTLVNSPASCESFSDLFSKQIAASVHAQS
jgi:hypothetical protein